MAKFTKIPETTFKSLQINAGILLKTFNPAEGSFTDADLLGATSGGVSFEATPSFTDFGEDIDNCPKNTKELKRLDDWEVKMSGDFVSMSADLAAMLANGDVSTGKVTPRRDLMQGDFKDLWWVGDYSDVNTGENAGFLAVHLINALSTGGFSITSNDKNKGTFGFEFTGHFSMNAQDVVPFEIYVKTGTQAGA